MCPGPLTVCPGPRRPARAAPARLTRFRCLSKVNGRPLFIEPGPAPGYLAGPGFTLEWDAAVSDAATRFYPEGHCPSVPAYYHVAASRRN
jgi:hypothetical protein